MINLIPNEQKKAMVRSFYFRFAVVSVFMASFSLLVGSVLLLPSFYLSTLRVKFMEDKVASQKLEPEPTVNPKTSLIIKDLDTKLSIVEKTSKNSYSVTTRVINEIVLKKMSDIKIEEIYYKNDPVAGRSVSIRGMAPSRVRLLLFRRVLEDDVAFKKVDLPISNFVKGSNIAFYLNLIPS